MIKELDKLRALGAQKIYEDTHIPLPYIQSMIHESFEGLNRVQFLGFVSILEREYGSELEILREKGLEYFETQKSEKVRDVDLFGNPEKKHNLIPVYIAIALVVIAFIVYQNFLSASKDEIVIDELDNSAIDTAKEKITVELKEAPTVVDKNETNVSVKEDNVTETNMTVVSVVDTNKSSQSVVKSEIPRVKEKKELKKLAPLVIKPRKKVWVGYINKTDNTKKQAVVKHILTLDPEKVWLLSFGHGMVDINVNSKRNRFSSSKAMRFIYKNGRLKPLSVKEFKKLNRGRLW